MPLRGISAPRLPAKSTTSLSGDFVLHVEEANLFSDSPTFKAKEKREYPHGAVG
jgi:hypothetical protein